MDPNTEPQDIAEITAALARIKVKNQRRVRFTFTPIDKAPAAGKNTRRVKPRATAMPSVNVSSAVCRDE